MLKLTKNSFHLLILVLIFTTCTTWPLDTNLMSLLWQEEMGDIRQSLLPRDVLSAAKELLYHLDIYICNLVQSGRQPAQVDAKTLELVEEFILHSPKDRNTPSRV